MGKRLGRISRGSFVRVAGASTGSLMMSAIDPAGRQPRERTYLLCYVRGPEGILVGLAEHVG